MSFTLQYDLITIYLCTYGFVIFGVSYMLHADCCESSYIHYTAYRYRIYRTNQDIVWKYLFRFFLKNKLIRTIHVCIRFSNILFYSKKKKKYWNQFYFHFIIIIILYVPSSSAVYKLLWCHNLHTDNLRSRGSLS